MSLPKQSAWDFRYDNGADLTVEFAGEIAAAPYSGDPWAWIKARIRADYTRDIHVGDWLPLILTDGNTFKMEANIDTYRGTKYGANELGSHIDFISRDCHPDPHVFNKAAYNNGTTISPCPWLASDLYAWLNSLQSSVPNAATANPALVAVDYRQTGVLDKFPAGLRDLIVPKDMLIPVRYTAGSLLTDDNGFNWGSVGKLWIPSEFEVCGYEQWGSKNGYSNSVFQQYPIFAYNAAKRTKHMGEGGDRAWWWLLSTRGTSTDRFLCFGEAGNGYFSNPTSVTVYVPVCFRIA
jgi:hypothetical protein